MFILHEQVILVNKGFVRPVLFIIFACPRNVDKRIMDNNNEIAEQALDQLHAKTGIVGNWQPMANNVDGEVELQVQSKVYKAFTAVKKELRQYQLADILAMAETHKPFMVIAEHIFTTIKQRLREENIGYIDAAGNIYLNNNNTCVWIDGNKAPQKTKKITNRAFTKAGLKVVFYLLLNDKAINMPYRQLAQLTGAAVGNIQNVFEGLKEARFILQKNKQQKILSNKKALLNRWVDGYRETLKPALHIGNFTFWDKDNFKHWQTLQLPAIAEWGGEAAAEAITNYLTPEKLTLYIQDNRGSFISKWKLIPNEGGYLQMYQKFWHSEALPDSRFVPPLLVYADLMVTDDPRCIETATIVYNKYLKAQYEPGV